MASGSQKNTLPIAAVFTNLFHNIPRLILTNLIFAVPLGAFTALFWFLSSLLPLSESQAPLIVLLAVIPVFPFYAGVVKVTAKMTVDEEKVPVFRNFFSGVKDNFLRFLVHGLLLYVIVVFSFVSISLYMRLIASNSVFIGPLIISIIIMLLFVFMFFYVPAMTVTFDIPMRYIYKNSFLMSYGEIKKNIIGLLGVLLLLIISTTFLIACYGSPVAVVVVTIVLAALVIPAISAFIIHSAVYERMCEMITDKSVQTQAVNAVNAKMVETRNKRNPVEVKDEFMSSIKEFEVDESLSDDEYVYFNGKMMKKGVIMKLKREAERSGE